MSQILLTVVSENYNVLATPTARGFESTSIVDLQVNVETALGGNSSFTLDGKFYTVSETTAVIATLTGGGGVSQSSGAAVSGVSTAVEYGDGVVHQTVITLSGTEVTMRDTEQGGGVKIYDFPKGRILFLGGSANIAVTTTSELASTLNAGVTCNYGVGTTTQANATVATTEQDLINVAAFTSSATIDVAGADAPGHGIAVLAAHDGTSTAIDAFLNLAVAGATDIDGDATVTVDGTVTLTWVNQGLD